MNKISKKYTTLYHAAKLGAKLHNQFAQNPNSWRNTELVENKLLAAGGTLSGWCTFGRELIRLREERRENRACRIKSLAKRLGEFKISKIKERSHNSFWLLGSEIYCDRFLTQAETFTPIRFDSINYGTGTYGGWPKSDCHLTMIINPITFRSQNLTTIDGVLTYRMGPDISADCYPAIWWRDGRGYNKTQVEGWIFGGDTHVTAASLEKARAKYEKMHKARMAAQAEREERDRIANLKREERLQALIALGQSLPQKWVTVADSRRAGNCIEGTKAFAAKIGIDIESVGAVKSSFILSMLPKINDISLTERAINAIRIAEHLAQ